MNKMSDKRLEKLDTAIRFYSCMRKSEDEVVILMGKDLMCELLANANAFVMASIDDFRPYQYKGHFVELKTDLNVLAVAYFNKMTGKLHDIREIKEETT